MPFVTITYDISSLRDLRGRFAKANVETLKLARDSFRDMGRKLVEIEKEEAPKRSGEFAAGINFKTAIVQDGVELRTYSPKPLGNYIILGTRPHPIRPKRANALYFYWPKVGMYTIVPKRGGFTGKWGGKFWIGKGRVDHPGTRPDDFVTRAWQIFEPEVEKELYKFAGRWIKTVKYG